jgi:rhodanese-related sulfurtransferase
MEQIVEFTGNHPGLVIAFGVILGLLVWSFLGESISGIKSILPQDATLLINHENAIILDVRQESEYVNGHIINSIHIPLNNLANKISSLEKYRNRPIIANCMTGNRSSSACRTLKKHGFENVYNLKGGVMAWQNANLPLKKGKK